MKLNFCTLFNSHYLTRGLAMYQSLLKYTTEFHLYIFAFDTASYEYLHAKMLKNVTVISLSEFEDEELLKIKPTRTAGEYCWTCTPSTIYYCIEKYNLENCTYIDADLCFYANPKVLVDEMRNNSVLITEHRYTKEYDQTTTSGKYCVQFVTFKNDERGLIVLKWWRDACINWCYNRMEDGKFGDQKYLDDWATKFEGVHELQHLGGGVAPWNVQQYSLNYFNNKLYGKETSTGKKFEIVFFHFHGLIFYFDNIVSLTIEIYKISKRVKTLIYKPYIMELEILRKKIEKENKKINSSGITQKAGGVPITFRNNFGIFLLGLKRTGFKKPFWFLKNTLEHYHYFYCD